MEEKSFDKTDLAILRILLQDARRTLQEIGAEVGLSPTSCWSRIKRLQDEGVIQRYTVDVDPRSLGYHDTVIVQLTLESHTEDTLYAFGQVLATIPEVLEATLSNPTPSCPADQETAFGGSAIPVHVCRGRVWPPLPAVGTSQVP